MIASLNPPRAWPNRPPCWVGRERELALLRDGIEALSHGEGTAAWVEGEPGIGKSSLVAEALEAAQPGWEIGWSGADQLTGHLPLRVMRDCLGVRAHSPDPRRARAAELLGGWTQGPLSYGDLSATGIEVLLELADELCAAAPTVLVIDDLQWADEASLAVWHQLAASISQTRLLLIGICRPAPGRPEVQHVRAGVARRGGQLLSLGPLTEADTAGMVTAMVGAPPGKQLSRLTAQAAGNPLYVRELVDALQREKALRTGQLAEVARTGDRLPVSLAAVLEDRLGSVSEQAARTLRTAALLGGRFAVTDLATVLRRPVWDLAASLQEAVEAGIVEGSGANLAFRHALIRQALYESTPEALRAALHAAAARELATSGADALSVAQQLSSARMPGAGWVRAWLAQSAPALTARAPRLAAELLRGELAEMPVGDEGWDVLGVCLIRALIAVGAYEEAVGQARRTLTAVTDPSLRAETSWMLAHAHISARHGNVSAIGTLRRALAEADVPRLWEARLLALLAMLERDTTGIETADTIAGQAVASAGAAADPFTTAQALNNLWLMRSVRRDHVGALDCIDQALTALGDDPAHTILRSAALDSRTFTLQNLDEWPRAELALREAREHALRVGRSDRATWSTAAVLRYWLGQWDDALAELDADATDVSGLVYSYIRERWSALLVHGVAALIAGRRDHRDTAAEHLKSGLALPIENLTDLENRDFLVAAHALSLEQRGEERQAMLRLAELVPRGESEMTLTHQWLPDLVRLALAVGDRERALTAVRACQEEAAAETRPARAAAASLRCDGLFESDPDRLAAAVEHYRLVGPVAELPAVLEDLAVAHAEHDRAADARDALKEAVGLYENMQARWDIQRAEGRLLPYGVRLGIRGRRAPRASFGWESLTQTEVRVAALIARGDSTSDIARIMFLSRRTVQTYISRILVKIEGKSRVDVAREALSHGAVP